jgi:hypothetical protein
VDRDAIDGTTESPIVVEAGVIFADRESYLCLPFERLCLPVATSVVSVASSCECVEPQVVAYRTQHGECAKAVLLRFVKEDIEVIDPDAFSSTPIVAASLGVLVDVTLADGSTRSFKVNLLHTLIAREVMR